MHAGDIISGARRESMGRDLDGLQGTWNIVSLEMDGQKMPGGGARIEVRGNRFTTIAMGTAYAGTAAVHETTTPKSFELHFEEADAGRDRGADSRSRRVRNAWRAAGMPRPRCRPTPLAPPPGPRG